MINTESTRAVRESRFGNGFTKPLYDDYCFSQIPQTIRYLLTEDKRKGVPFGPRDDMYRQHDTVILFFIDAFGWRFVERFQDHPFLKRIAEQGVVNMITSQFPSTTAAHVTTIHTGLPVGQSGIYEWFYYEPLLDAMISPLLFSFAGDQDRETLLRTGANPATLFPTTTIYHDLANKGVASTVIQDARYAKSPYSDVAMAGARVVKYRSFPEAVATLFELLGRQEGPSYYFLYYDHIDAVCHQHGPNSLQLEAEIVTFLDTLENLLQPALAQQRDRTMFLMTADHAQVEIDPHTTMYLNRELPDLARITRRNRAGELLYPAGSARDVFLHIAPGHLSEAHEMLNHHFRGRASVCRVDDLIADGFFGSMPPSTAFMSRVGDLVVLPYANESVWYLDPPRFEQKYYGHHGGLAYQEMETVLLGMGYGR